MNKHTIKLIIIWVRVCVTHTALIGPSGSLRRHHNLERVSLSLIYFLVPNTYHCLRSFTTISDYLFDSSFYG